MEMNVVTEQMRSTLYKSSLRKRKNPKPFFLLFFVLCGILVVLYISTNSETVTDFNGVSSNTLKYTIDGDSIIIHNTPFLPSNDRQARNYWQILQQTVSNDNDEGDQRWVYELQTLGGYEYRNLRKYPPLLQLSFGETYKYGVAKDRGTFDTSINTRYPNNQMYLYVNISEFMKAESLRIYFRPVRKCPTTLPYKQAELLERILRFNYYLKNKKLPPGSAKF